MKEQQYEKAGEWRQYLQKYFQNQLQQKKEFVQNQYDFILSKKKELGNSDDFSVKDKNKQAIFHHLKSILHQKPTETRIDQLHPALFEKAHEILAVLHDVIIKQQKKERFRLLKTDGFFLKIRKIFKSFFFYLSRLPFFFLNIFRKKKKLLRYWKHEISNKKLFEKHLIIAFYPQMTVLENLIQREYLIALESVKDFEKHYEYQDNEILDVTIDYFNPEFEKTITHQINKWYEIGIDAFTRDFELAGTIEYRRRELSPKNLEKEAVKYHKKWEKNHHHWENTAYALYEDWRSELELSALQAFIQSGTFKLTTNIYAWNEKINNSYLKGIDQFLKEAHANFEYDKHEDIEELHKKITQVNYQTKKQLDQGLLQKLQETLAQNSLLNQIDRLEYQINERINQMGNQYVVTKNNRFNEPLADSDLLQISNFELLSFEIEPRLNDELEALKSSIFQKMDELLVLVGDIDEMVSYMLSTASGALDKEQNELEALKIISDGFQRAENKSAEAYERLKEIILICENELKKTTTAFISDLQELKENENVSALRIRLNKAKALQKSEVITQKVVNEAHKLYSEGKRLSIKLYRKALYYQEQFSRRFLSATISIEPNRAVSDFLSDSNTIIEQLPIIYKRLYAIEPLNDSVLFEGRENELRHLAKAYAAWEKGKYASVLFTGEKWSGLTSLINYGIKSIKFNQTPIRHAFSGNNPKTEDLFLTFSELLGNENLADSQSVIAHLNEGNKKIIILEDLQNIFLRVLHGQTALIALIEIITATQKNIFWIASMSVYTFNYLERSLKMSAFFSYHIPLAPMSAENISQLIIKRNRISGFKIEFEASRKDLQDKKYRRLNEKEKQLYLKERFFKELNAFAKSNISMALMYWLLSTRDVSGQSIVIRNFKKPDLSFLTSLQTDRIFILLSLVMHDGLREDQVAQVLAIDIQKVRFLVLEMMEDGILFHQNDLYMVNPIVYRNTVQLLRSKNMIIG
ncbi:hypothetical protein JKA74_05325 [Marivirga sp. S37H4]|uniref:Uncharacterized protein n=1 Tax=Marivirga aurantiaca TaxID=2802615 RepID=A0A934WX22_9BACT|nr:hypothetical protein [Marivirga aurantiaca]MBK6264450.1 hypothetical protein [Marivirga aurantiaca]